MTTDRTAAPAAVSASEETLVEKFEQIICEAMSPLQLGDRDRARKAAKACAEIEASRARQGVGLSAEAIERAIRTHVRAYIGARDNLVGVTAAARAIAALQPAPAPGGSALAETLVLQRAAQAGIADLIDIATRIEVLDDGRVVLSGDDYMAMVREITNARQAAPAEAGEIAAAHDTLTAIGVPTENYFGERPLSLKERIEELSGRATPAEAGEMGAADMREAAARQCDEMSMHFRLLKDRSKASSTSGAAVLAADISSESTARALAAAIRNLPLTPPAGRGSASSDGGE